MELLCLFGRRAQAQNFSGSGSSDGILAVDGEPGGRQGCDPPGVARQGGDNDWR
jgi:hypothetical protein